ncbi:MAG: c-type cytochrome [Rhodospirillaceae bacterium]
MSASSSSRKAFGLTLGILGCGLIGWWGWTQIGPSDPAPQRFDLALGAEIYADQCAACHGVNLEGQTPDWRKRDADGRLPAPPHDETGHTWHHPTEQLFDLTKYGVAAFAPEGYQSNMPAFEGVLSDMEIRTVLAFIKSQWPAEIQARHDQLDARP